MPTMKIAIDKEINCRRFELRSETEKLLMIKLKFLHKEQIMFSTYDADLHRHASGQELWLGFDLALYVHIVRDL